MTPKENREKMKLVDAAYWRMERCCESTNEWDRYVELIKQEQRDHLKFKPDHIKCGLTVAQAVRLFAVKQIFSKIVDPNNATPRAEDFFWVLKSLYAAAAIWDLCRAKLRNEFTDHEMLQWLSSIDYAALNADPRIAA